MLINLNHFLKSHYVEPKGIIHVGAHLGQEYDHYIECGFEKIIFIEPQKKVFDILQSKFLDVPGVELYNFACGRRPSEFEMYCETANQGQSSSILKPKIHLQEHPNINFTYRETVKVFPLNFLNTNGCNVLMMDVQGFELEVLRGADEVLKTIDVVYSEVNRREMYEDCPMIEDIDNYLKDFERKETKWAHDNLGWGDAIYKKVRNLAK